MVFGEDVLIGGFDEFVGEPVPTFLDIPAVNRGPVLSPEVCVKGPSLMSGTAVACQTSWRVGKPDGGGVEPV